MEISNIELPLLPVPVVLFPGTFMPLSVESDGFREMLCDFFDNRQVFGAVYASADYPLRGKSVPALIGCVATVELIVNKDGSDNYYAVLEGHKRMRVLNVTEGTPLSTATIEYLPENPGNNAANKANRAMELFRKYLALIRDRYQLDNMEMVSPNDPNLTSYLLASILMMPQDVKQRCLESETAAYRLEEELGYLEKEVENLEILHKISEKTKKEFSFPDPEYFANLLRISEN